MKCIDTNAVTNEQRFSVGAQQFRAALGGYPPADQEMLEWLWGYLYQSLGGQAQTLVRELGIPYLDLHRVLSGRETQQYSAVIAAAAALRRRAAKQIPLVETEVTRAITETLDYARDYAAMVAIVGSTGRGKTYTAKHWAAQNNHGRTRYIRMTSNPGRSTLLYKLCEAAGTGWSGYKNAALEQRVLTSGAYGPRNVVIIDEAGHLIPRSGSGTGAIEFIRDLHDNCGCAVALIFTDVYLEQMRLGHLKRYFEQFLGRIEKVVKIPENPSIAEVEEFVNSYAPGAGDDLVAAATAAACAEDGKLRTLARDLQKASLLAQSEKRVMVVDDLHAAIAWRQGNGL